MHHRSTNSTSSVASVESNTSNAAAAYLLQQLGSVGSNSGNPGVTSTAGDSGGADIYGSGLVGLTSIPQQQQQQQQLYRIVLPQQQTDGQASQVAHYSPGIVTTMMGVMSVGNPAIAPSSNIPRITFPDRERQIKRRTKTGCMTCRKRRIKCDEGKPTCLNCQKSRRECEGYQIFPTNNPSTNAPTSTSSRSESLSPPLSTVHFQHASDFNALPTPSTATQNPPSSGFSPINARRVQSPRFTPYDVYPRTPVEPPPLSTTKEFDPLSGNEYLATDFANVPQDFLPTEFMTSDSAAQVPTTVSAEELSTPPPTARISIDSLLNLSSAALVHPPIDAPLNALFSPTTNLLPAPLLRPHNASLFAHWINILSAAMGTLDRFPADSSVLESTAAIHYPTVRVPHEDSVYSFLIPHLAMAPTGGGVLHAILACAASHTRQRILGMKNYHLAVRAVKEDTERGVTYFVAVTLLGMYEVLGGKGIRCMYLARDWLIEHKEELKARQRREGIEVTVRDVITEHMMWTFARTAIHRGFSTLPSIAPREGFLLPMSDFQALYVPRESGDSTVGVADNLVILLAQLLSLPTLGEFEFKSHVAHQLYIWPSTLPRAFRPLWTSHTNISTTSLSAMHFLHPSIAAINLLHRAGIIYFSIYFDFNISRKSSPEAISAARDVLRITQPLMDEASAGRWSVLGALTLGFGPVFIAGQFLKFHLRDTPFVVPPMDWLEESFGEVVETEEDVELREVERMIDRLKVYLGGVEGRVFEL